MKTIPWESTGFLASNLLEIDPDLARMRRAQDTAHPMRNGICPVGPIPEPEVRERGLEWTDGKLTQTWHETGLQSQYVLHRCQKAICT